MNLLSFENLFIEKAKEICRNVNDPGHDFLHIQRVVENAKKIAQKENGNLWVIIPASYFHDFIIVPKNDPRRKEASKMSAEAAINYLKSVQYPDQYFEEIYEAIHGHSFSANVQIKSLSAKIVQDADRLDGIGAIGVARAFAISGLLNRDFYNGNDPFHETRELNDQIWTLDHFYIKILKVCDRLNTDTAKKIGQSRQDFMLNFIQQLKSEI